MRARTPISADEMVAAFLRAEIDSDRYAGGIRDELRARHQPDSVVWSPNLEDPTENEVRAHILGARRGWRLNEWIFEGLPVDVAWHLVGLDSTEAGQVLLANYAPLLPLSGSSRRFADAAANVRAGRIPPADGEAGQLAARAIEVAERYSRGDSLEPPILVTSGKTAPLIALEGHTRLLGWALAALDVELKVIVGTSGQLAAWKWV